MSDDEFVTEADRSLDLLAQIVGANVKNLEHTTNLLIENLEKQVQEMAQLVVDMQTLYASASVVDRATQAKWRHLDHRIDIAFDIFNRQGEI